MQAPLSPLVTRSLGVGGTGTCVYVQQVERASTLSISLGPSMLDVVLPMLADVERKPEGERPALYACENDHDSVHKLQEALEGACLLRVRVFLSE